MQCAKQPIGSVTCGFYACEYLRACGRYSSSWRQLKKSKNWWEKENIGEKNFDQTISDICKFLLEQCCDEQGNFFYAKSQLGTDPRLEKLRQWRSGQLNMNDYKLPELFD
jgi:hypothetical protein